MTLSWKQLAGYLNGYSGYHIATASGPSPRSRPKPCPRLRAATPRAHSRAVASGSIDIVDQQDLAARNQYCVIGHIERALEIVALRP